MTAPAPARDCAELARTHALADGELAGDDAAAARDHLASCAACQAELSDVLQLDAAASGRPVARVIPLSWYRRRSLQVVAAALAAAAAVVVYLALPRPRGSVPAAPEAQLALAPHRATEARLAWSGAAAYRAYDVPRAGDAPHEAIDLMAIAQLDKRGDAHGVGVLELLNGERRQAATYLERAGDSPDVVVDRAALALADNQPERALSLADAALARRSGHPAALWNRALALRDLGLSRSAAAGFREVAALGEPGWAAEARQRAGALDAETDALQKRYDRITAASSAFARGKIELTADDARAQPGFARGILYDAIRSAQTPAQLAALRPLADVIDAADRDTAMKDALDRAGAALHPELSRQYAEMIRSLAVEMYILPRAGDELPLPSGPARTRLLAALRAAHATDLLIGVLMKLTDDRYTVNAGDIAEFARLTEASPDPWIRLLGLAQQAQVALQHDDLIGAEAILLRARQRCTEPGAPPFRCISIARSIGDLYLRWHRLPEARTALTEAWAAARSSGEWLLQSLLLVPLAQLASQGDDTEGTGLPLVRGYLDEIVERFPAAAVDDRCHTEAWGRDLRANMLLDQLRFAEAHRMLAGPACGKGGTPVPSDQIMFDLFVRSQVVRAGGTPDELTALRAEIAAARAGASRSDQVLLDHAEGRVVIDKDPAAGEALLRRAIAAARPLPPSMVAAHKAAGWSTSVLAVARAQHGDADAALALLAQEQDLALPARCVVGLAIEDQRRAVVARDAAGAPIAHYDEGRTTPAIDPVGLVPAEITRALAGCDAVDVIARPPLQGMSRLLDDAVAWRYLAQRSRPAGAMTGPSVVVANALPPPALQLPHLTMWSQADGLLSGPAATPSRVLAAIGGAGDVTVHAHGLVDVSQPDASFLALSPEPSGRFALTTGDVRKARFATSPLIILAACRSSRAAPVWHETWSLPAAFVHAGARAVIASAAPIDDADAAEFFAGVRARVRAGVPAAIAVRDARQRWLADRRRDWVRDVIVFE